LSSISVTAAECNSAPEMAHIYCDNDFDLVADVPADPEKWRNPKTLVWAYTPIEDPAVYAALFKPLTNHLEQCLGRQVVYYPVQSNAAQIDAMRSGRLHFAGFATGPTSAAVNLAGAVPFAGKGVDGVLRGYELIAVVAANSPYESLEDLKGKRVAHVSPSSNSGNLAPRALFPAEGLTPGVDYTPIMSGGHDKSIQGVLAGDYEMAAVASDVMERMIERGLLQRDDIRVIYTSPTFPTSSFAHAHDLAPELAESLKACFFSFRFPQELREEFHGDEQFVPITYAEDWAVVKAVASQSSGSPESEEPH
jgi:phosphonate transport system substrate-binding protein